MSGTGQETPKSESTPQDKRVAETMRIVRNTVGGLLMAAGLVGGGFAANEYRHIKEDLNEANDNLEALQELQEQLGAIATATPEQLLELAHTLTPTGTPTLVETYAPTDEEIRDLFTRTPTPTTLPTATPTLTASPQFIPSRTPTTEPSHPEATDSPPPPPPEPEPTKPTIITEEPPVYIEPTDEPQPPVITENPAVPYP